jgi:uncharacterized protein YigE (DUF2233 family)
MTYAMINRAGKRALVLLGSVILLALGISQAPADSSVFGHEFRTAKTQEGFPYLTGGISIDERQLMAERDDEYNLKLVFAEKSGIYLADVKLGIFDQKGQQIAAVTAPGPWFYIQLPPGKYDVRASFDGRTKTIRSIPVLKAQQTSRIFHWDLPSEPEHPELVSH